MHDTEALETTMTQARAIILRAAGTNCDMETEYAFRLAGASADRVHVNRVIGDPGLLDRYHILVFPGGFSYGDDVAAGRILANQIVHHVSDAVRRFIDNGKLVLGICNGFQVLVKAGILPGLNGSRQEDITIACNDSGKYEDRWVSGATDEPLRVHRAGATNLPAGGPRRGQGHHERSGDPAATEDRGLRRVHVR